MVMDNKALIIERVFEANIQQVWKAIANKDEMKEWYFNLEAFEPKVGFEFQFYGQGTKG